MLKMDTLRYKKRAADREALKLGTEDGLWCVGSYGAMVLFPILLLKGHFFAVALVSLLIFCERLDPAWTLSRQRRGFGAASRYPRFQFLGPEPNQLPLHPAAQSRITSDMIATNVDLFPAKL